jgi:hypothetical protein
VSDRSYSQTEGQNVRIFTVSALEAENRHGITVSALKIVTLAQQSAAISQQRPESPKKAATAAVFGLP